MAARLEKTKPLFHIARRDEWESSGGRMYLPSGYDSEGFIHLSFASQLIGTYNRYYRGQYGLVLLVIRLSPESMINLKTEDLTGKGELFPHLYQPLDKGDVTNVFSIPSDGGSEAFFLKVLVSETKSD